MRGARACRGQLNPAVRQIADAIQNEAQPVSQSLTVFRGMRGVDTTDWKVGDLLPTFGPFSTTLYPRHAAVFSRGGQVEGSVYMVITLPTGQRVVASNTSERELTIPEGYSLIVDRLHRDAVDTIVLEDGAGRGKPNLSLGRTVVEATVVKNVPEVPVITADPKDRLSNDFVKVELDEEGRIKEVRPLTVGEVYSDEVELEMTQDAISDGDLVAENLEELLELPITEVGVEEVIGLESPYLKYRTPDLSSEALRYYSSFYREVSSAFRTGRYPVKVVETVNSMVDDAVPLPNPLTVFRSIGIKEGLVYEYNVGQIVPSLGPFSTSMTLGAGLTIASRRAEEITEGVVVMFAIRLEEGQMYVADNFDEQEITIPYGYALKIDNISEGMHVKSAVDLNVFVHVVIEATVVKLEDAPPLLALTVEFIVQAVKKGDKQFDELKLQDQSLKGMNLQGIVSEGSEFTEVDFTSSVLSGGNFFNSVFNGSTFKGVVARGSNFRQAIIQGSNVNMVGAAFEDSNFIDAIMSGVNLEDAIFTGSNLTRANLSADNLKNANFTRAILNGANFNTAVVDEASFVGASMKLVKMQHASVRDVDFQLANLKAAEFIGTDLTDTYFGGANLQGANLRGATLTETDFESADLRGADLRDTNLGEALLEGANLEGAKLPKGFKRP